MPRAVSLLFFSAAARFAAIDVLVLPSLALEIRFESLDGVRSRLGRRRRCLHEETPLKKVRKSLGARCMVSSLPLALRLFCGCPDSQTERGGLEC